MIPPCTLLRLHCILSPFCATPGLHVCRKHTQTQQRNACNTECKTAPVSPPHARGSKERFRIVNWITAAFSPHISPRAELERPPHLKLNEGGVVPVHYNDIQAPFIQPLSNGLWTANAPPSGGRSPLITPPNPNTQPPTIAPTKERGESAPVVRAAAPGLLRYAGKIFLCVWITLENVPRWSFLRRRQQ